MSSSIRMNNDQDLEIVSEILQGVTVARSSFGRLYFRHLSQFEQREIISESKLFEKEAVSKGLLKEEDAIEEMINQEMWSYEQERKIKRLKQEVENFKNLSTQAFLPSKKKEALKKAKELEHEVALMEKEKQELMGLTAEKYANNKIQNNIVGKILFYDREFKKSVYEDLYINENFKEVEIYKLQNEFFKKFQDSNISKAVLSDYFSMYLPFCEDVLGVFGKPLADLTSYQLKLISFGRYYLNIFKNTSKEIPEHVAKDPELLVNFYQSQKTERTATKSQQGEGGSAYFGANQEDIESLKSSNETAVDLSEEVKKRGGSLNMQEMMKLHGV